MPTYDYAFSGGTSGIQGYGDRWQIQFGGTWVSGEEWGLIFTSTSGDYDVGAINFFNRIKGASAITFCFTYKDRVYVCNPSQFNFSDNGDPTGWEQQNAGAGFETYLSSFGGQDTVYTISQLQGRIVVLARRSVQIWTVDADPGNFAIVQSMDNIGTVSPFSPQNIGDLDVITLDDTGFRSVRTREVTLNAYVDDVGTPVDSLVQADLAAVSFPPSSFSVVDPVTKNYWCYLNGKFYVLARFPSGKISAWSTYLPTYETYTTVTAPANYTASKITLTVVQGSVYKWTPGAHEVSLVNGTQTLTAASYFIASGTSVLINGTGATVTYTGLLQLVTVNTFTPGTRPIIFQGIIYIRTADNFLLAYGGSAGTSYDGAQATLQIPWLDDKLPKLEKLVQAVDAALVGDWTISMSADPVSGTFSNAFASIAKTGSELTDSTYDYRRIAWAQKGTHISVKLVSAATWSQLATVSELQIHYNKGATV